MLKICIIAIAIFKDLWHKIVKYDYYSYEMDNRMKDRLKLYGTSMKLHQLKQITTQYILKIDQIKK